MNALPRLVRALFAGAAVLVLAAANVTARAQEASRPFNPIARPAVRLVLPDGAVRLNRQKPVKRDDVEAAIGKVVQAWNDLQRMGHESQIR